MKDSTKPSRSKKAEGRGLDGEGSSVGPGLRDSGAGRGKPEGAAGADGKKPKASDGATGTEAKASKGKAQPTRAQAKTKAQAKAKTKTETETETETEASTKGNGADGARRDAQAAAVAADDQELVTLRLYVAGQTPRSLAALANLRKVCDEYLAPRYKIELEIVDLLEKPQLAQADQIFAIPTLVRKLPSPIKRIIGDLSNTERVLIGLDIHGGK